VIFVEPGGTSQECSGCGILVEKALSERTHSCPHCGLELDRDVNAARNIQARDQEQARVETEPLPVIRMGKFGRGSRKATAFRRGSFTRYRWEIPPGSLQPGSSECIQGAMLSEAKPLSTRIGATNW
jgi:predicted RNA-binding Zn-ribbon protein involved in translation (DUF1610 family)